MALQARRVVERLLKSGPKTGEQLRREYLGEMPEALDEQKAYNTKSQALRRALDDLIKERFIEDAKYRLMGEVADQKYIRASMVRFEKTTDPSRQLLLMEDIGTESQKRDAINTGRLLIFLTARLAAKSEDLRKLAIRCLWHMSRKMDESRRRDADSLLAMRKQCGRKLLDAVMQDASIEVRKEALKLLIDIGDKQTISLVENIIRSTSIKDFREFKPVLKQFLVQPYQTNRLLRAHKGALRDMLHDLVLSDDRALARRAEVVLWSLRHGQADMPGGEDDIH